MIPAAPRVPLGEPAETDRDAAWEDHGSFGVHDGVRLAGAPGSPDLADVRFSQCVVAGADLGEAELRGSRWEACSLSGVFAPQFSAARSGWRHVVARQLRVGAADLVDASVSGVAVYGAKLGRVDLRRATVTDVLVEDAVIEELDLDEARLTRVAFRGCRIGRLSLAASVLRDVDLRGAELRVLGPVTGLRGATVGADQLQDLAPAIAHELGLRVV